MNDAVLVYSSTVFLLPLGGPVQWQHSVGHGRVRWLEAEAGTFFLRLVGLSASCREAVRPDNSWHSSYLVVHGILGLGGGW